MNYEEKYKEIVGQLKKAYLYAQTDSTKAVLEEIYPELSESEDEKVIKEIIELVMQPTWKTEEEFHRRNVLCAWLENVPVTIDHEKREGFHLGYKACLEKRGEQKPADSYCQENCKGFQETGKCFADGECKAKREAEQNLAENAKPQSSTPMSYGKELEKRMYEACNRFFAPNTDSNRYSASDLFYAGVKAERDLNTLAWSEEDDKMLNDAIGAVAAADYYTLDDKQDIENWLQSLKDRVQPKPMYKFGDTELTKEEVCEGLIRGMVNEHNRVTKEVLRTEYEKGRADAIAKMQGKWSDVDKDILFRIIDDLKFLRDTISIDPKYAVNIIDMEREITWLKSLRPQNRWKPTNEQMGCLSDAIEHYNSLGYPAPKLKELLDDLKKLKEGKV